MTKKRDAFDHPEWAAFEHNIRTNMLPKMRESATVLALAPDISQDLDLRFAIQIGACILLEKPLLVLAMKGRTLPPKLVQIADRIIYAEGPNDPKLQDEVAKFMNDFGRQ